MASEPFDPNGTFKIANAAPGEPDTVTLSGFTPVPAEATEPVHVGLDFGGQDGTAVVGRDSRRVLWSHTLPAGSKIAQLRDMRILVVGPTHAPYLLDHDGKVEAIF